MKNLLSIIKKVILRKPETRISTLEIPEPTLKVVNSTDEEGRELAENMRKYVQLLMWMRKHSDEIFAEAPHNEIYAVGIYRENKKPEIHYFNSEYTKRSLIDRFRKSVPMGALDLMKELAEKGEVNTFLIEKYQDGKGMMLAAG